MFCPGKRLASFVLIDSIPPRSYASSQFAPFTRIPAREAFVCTFVSSVVCLIFLSAFSPTVALQSPDSSQTAPAKPDLASGKIMFERHCALCHGMDGSGGRGPSLLRPKLSHAPDDAALSALIETGIGSEMPPAWFLTKDEISALAAYLRSLGNVAEEPPPGDPERGKAVYVRTGCSACHRINGLGSSYGPDLSDVGSRRGNVHLRETVRNAAKTLPEDFLLVEAITASAQTIRGIRLNEDTFSIQLKDQQSRFYSFRRNELRDLKKLRGETPMPSYGSVLSEADLDDLISFLASQRGKP